jgi:hypothetical protein
MMLSAATLPAIDQILDEHAEAIRVLGKRTIENVIEIGHRLTEARKLCEHGQWLPWLEREFGWTDRHARNFMAVYEISSKSENFSDLNLPISGLYLLAHPSTPEAARQQVVNRAASGERISVTEIKQEITEAKTPAPKSPATKPKREPPPKPVINQDQINEAMKIIRAMDIDTWKRFDRIYQKARDDELGYITF